MNDVIEEDDLFTIVEPPISYYSSSINCGVTAIFSKNEIKSYKRVSKLFMPVSPKNNFSLCNTIMLPFIINQESIDNDNINNNMNHSALLIKGKDLNQNSLKIDNTRNKTLSTKGENKENDDSLNEKTINQKDNINLERNPFFLGKNLSTNLLNENKFKNEDFNIRYNNEKMYESENNNSKNEGIIKDFMNRDQCKSVNIHEARKKHSILKDENKKDKSDFLAKKNKKAKIKESFYTKKSNLSNKDKKDNIRAKYIKKKSFFCRDQSKSFIEDEKKESSKKVTNERNNNYTNKELKKKTFYYSNKMINQNYNENYFKSIIKKKYQDKLTEKDRDRDKDRDKDNKENKDDHLGKTERKKKKKNSNKTPLREINLNNKSIKLKFPKAINLKFNNESSQKRHGINILKDHIKNKDKDKDKKDDSSQSSSISITKVKIKNSKTKKTKIKKYPSKIKEKDNKDSDTDGKKNKNKTPNRRSSGFSVKKKVHRRNSDNDNSEPKTLKSIRLRNTKEKDVHSKSQYSLKDYSVKNKLNNSLSKKSEIESLKNSLDERENINKITTLLRRKRSISMHLDNSKVKEVAEAIKQKKPINILNNSLSTTNFNINNKFKKIKKQKFDFESAIKKNVKKMQFNLFSKDKFTNTEFSDSDYLKYTLNCMELILDIDIEKQTRLKNKINFNFPKPKKKGIKKRIALFDLDETLVHCTGDINIKKDKYQHSIEIKLPGKQAVQVGINLRPYWKQTLNLIKKNYHIVIYTASHQAYADAVLDFMDPKKKYFKYRLYRNNCSLIDVEGAKFYVKDLDILNEHYDLKDIVIIDNSVLSFAYHLHNGIPIVPYYDEDKDGSLYVVGLYLIHIFPENDLREANKTQINLDSFLEEAKKLRDEDENIIDEEDDDIEEQEENENTQQNNEKNDGKENAEVKKIKSLDVMKTNGKNPFHNRKSTFMGKSLINPRRQSHDFTQKKLISQSKLINMYYEVNDESTKSLQNKMVEINQESKKNENNINTISSLSQDKNDNTKSGYIITENGEIDCKSDPGYPLNNQNNNNSDNDSSDDEIGVLKRGFTIIDDEQNEDNNNNVIKGKLKFIRSNFFNKFKIK